MICSALQDKTKQFSRKISKNPEGMMCQSHVSNITSRSVNSSNIPT